MMKWTLLLSLTAFFSLLCAMNYDDASLCLKKEQWQILDKHKTALQDSAFADRSDAKWVKLYKDYALARKDTLTALICQEVLVNKQPLLSNAIEWKLMDSQYGKSHPGYHLKRMDETLPKLFPNLVDAWTLSIIDRNLPADSLYKAISQFDNYNDYIEDLAKEQVDNISVERNDSLSYAMVQKFYATFPHSKWLQCVYYFELSHYLVQKDYPAFISKVNQNKDLSPAHSFISTLFLTNPALRRALDDSTHNAMLNLADSLLFQLSQLPVTDVTILYDTYDTTKWQFKLTLQQAKIAYFRQLASLHRYGDEDSLYMLTDKPDTLITHWADTVAGLYYPNNDAGELAEKHFWIGKLYSISSLPQDMDKAARNLIQCLVYGAPRKKYDPEAFDILTRIHKKLKIKTDVITWARHLADYNGIIFTDISAPAGLKDNRESRVAWGDYDNDSYPDLLLNGRRLYHNNGDLTFTEKTDSLGLSFLASSGGLFADFNLDGMLDFMTISSDDSGNGERLMKNIGKAFQPVNDKAGDIDDRFPTEGAAWVDSQQDMYPDLYCANYEKWQVRDGYEDRFWQNDKGYFTDKTKALGFLTPDYTHDNGQCGRGVAPADFDNDGDQEILVTNYRLDRNFLWDKQDSLYTDIAALDDVQGILNQGYYGHSIGADWGDYDNDGDLDLFIANLAHPRYIAFSNISMLLRNDGVKVVVIEGDTLRYTQFTDVTKAAGITYDELHSDPLWFDADNDGYLDLFITSVYENDRTYLYHNNGDGTFTDITWLAGARVYNGWGNATADINHDGKADLAVGSGNGLKLLLNRTLNTNKSLVFKPIWEDGHVYAISSYQAMKTNANSPAWGARIAVTLSKPDGSTMTLIRELCSAKGTTSQNEPILHFGLGKNKVVDYQIVYPESW